MITFTVRHISYLKAVVSVVLKKIIIFTNQFIEVNLTLYKFEILFIYQHVSASPKYSFFRILRDVSS